MATAVYRRDQVALEPYRRPGSETDDYSRSDGSAFSRSTPARKRNDPADRGRSLPTGTHDLGRRSDSQVREVARGARSQSQTAGKALSLAGRYRLFRGFLLALGVLHIFGLLHHLLEPVHAAFGVHQLLAASEERVTAGADFHADVALVGGSGLEGAPAGTDDVDLVVGGVNSGFHWSKILSELQCSARVKRPAIVVHYSFKRTTHSLRAQIQTPAQPERPCGGT